MSSNGEEVTDEVCASCGKAAVDNIKLKICTACKMVKYCSVECQKNHRKQHKKACNKRVRQMRDDLLFSQPGSHYLGECPICCFPLSNDVKKNTIHPCCCKYICNGCSYANQMRDFREGLQPRCPFCREPQENSKEAVNKKFMKRAEANDPAALREMGTRCSEEGDYETALEYFTKAAGLGNVQSHHQLSVLYGDGKGVEKDKKKELYHMEEAAIGGHPWARYNLGYSEIEAAQTGTTEERMRSLDKAVKHWIIGASLGCDHSMDGLKNWYSKGIVDKDDFEAALRAHQAAVDATKSQPRDVAAAFASWSQI